MTAPIPPAVATHIPVAAPALVADCGGLIGQIALAVPTAFFQSADVFGGCRPLVPIGNLIRAFPAELEVCLLVDDTAVRLANNWIASLDSLCSLRLAVLDSSAGVVPGPWIQDMFHVRTASARHTGFDHACDMQFVLVPGNPVGRCLADFLAVAVAELSLDLPGGNQLVGGDFRLIGHSDLQRASPVDTSSCNPLRMLDPRPVSVFGYRLHSGPASADTAFSRLHQYGFHVDQFVSLTGLHQEGRPLLLVGEPHLAEQGSILVDNARMLLDASVALLVEQGFAVIRNPVPFVVAPDSGKRLPRLYNNVIVENAVREGRSKPMVWLPQFADAEPLANDDARNCMLWEELGFDVVPVPGWSHLASRNGALRCASKVLKRIMDQDPCKLNFHG
ncbi:hypothetical protein PDO_0021 [Rhizobium sp. PDO1-076]|uniref:hypothetical protein n=1 Tax=Rhizobium sp. PDO1-076 TaxID=1125979 RepID=UPI00024E258F|nr:hypothetical protein [Rhizobium sp. PDO1-076]EHS52393.1 hypothetical protein PDO_0021 [Rhizobium sp. PDO1-076]